MCHKLARLSAALVLTAGVCGVSHGEIVRIGAGQSDGSATAGGVNCAIPSHEMATAAVPDAVLDFLNNPLRSTNLVPSPREIVHEEPVIAPPVESQMVPLPPSFWTGMSGLLALGFVRAAKRVRRTLH